MGGSNPENPYFLNIPSHFVHQVFFVFNDLPEWQTLAAAAPAGAEAVVLDGGLDRLDQIATHLQGRSGIDAIHILRHGGPGQVQLGCSLIGAHEVQERADVLSRIGDSLTEDGDILLYGCDVAQGPGMALVEQVASITRADVAASANRTGAASLGGDWVLEAIVGAVEGGVALNAAALQAYAHTLALADQSFDAEVPRPLAPGAEATGETIAGITYSLASPATMNGGGGIAMTSNKASFSITPNNSDLAVVFNYSPVGTALLGAFDARIKSADDTGRCRMAVRH